MRLGLRMGLNSRKGGGSALDPDARLYIAAVEAVLPGNNITTALPNAVNPKRIISDFFKAEKAAGRWTLHKRIYLPIYNNAAASAIDMVSRLAGEFTLSGVTHAAGYVHGDGTSGYFDTKSSSSDLSVTTDSGYLFALCTTASTLGFRGLVGRSQSTTAAFSFLSSLGGQLYRHNSNASQVSSSATGTGILSASRFGGSRSIYRRITSSRSVLISTAGADSGTVPPNNILAMAINNNAGTGITAGDFNDARFGAFGIGLGFSDANDSGFSANLKILWESLTGLTLP